MTWGFNSQHVLKLWPWGPCFGSYCSRISSCRGHKTPIWETIPQLSQNLALATSALWPMWWLWAAWRPNKCGFTISFNELPVAHHTANTHWRFAPRFASTWRSGRVHETVASYSPCIHTQTRASQRERWFSWVHWVAHTSNNKKHWAPIFTMACLYFQIANNTVNDSTIRSTV